MRCPFTDAENGLMVAFSGKIIRVEIIALNLWRFHFSGGSSVDLTAETEHIGNGLNIPVLAISSDSEKGA